MKLSRSIILASCMSVVFLAGAASCIVEDRNLEEKDVFKCMSDEDCLHGSVCVKPKPDAEIEGTCRLESEVEHCHDYDGDGYYAADEGYEQECGFSEKNPRDADDSNPNVNPAADELCDGLDNDQDGCVDGTCSEEGACTGEDKSKCMRLFRACYGGLSLSEAIAVNSTEVMSVCDPRTFGGMFCVPVTGSNGEVKHQYVFGYYDESGRADYANAKDVVLDDSQKECQNKDRIMYTPGSSDHQTASGSSQTRYVSDEAAEKSLYDNGIDEDCDGADSKAEATVCVEPSKTVLCVVSKKEDAVGIRADTAVNRTRYTTALDKCKAALGSELTEEEVLARCGCVGEVKCLTTNAEEPVCVHDGQEINGPIVEEHRTSGVTGDIFWDCYGES